MKDTKFTPPPSVSLFGRLRGWFFAGLLVTAPVLLTIYIIWLFIDIIDGQVASLMPASLHDYIMIEAPIIGQVPGVGLLVGVFMITLIGAITAGFFGRWLVRMGENLLGRMPIIRSIYGASKQILETVLSTQSNAFREVVLLEYPRKGVWVIGFVTGTTKGEAQLKIKSETVNIFVPTTPNPTSGFLLFCPKSDVIYMDMGVEDAVKLVVSGGIVTPPYTKPKAALTAKKSQKSKSKRPK